MEYIFPTNQKITYPLPMDARITPPPEKMEVTYPSTLSCAPPSESSETISETTQSSDGATTASPPSKKHHRKRPSVSRSRSDNTQGLIPNNNNPIFSPRPYENLYTERAYLSASLQLQADRAADLMKQYSLAEAQHQNLEAGKERRRLRKYLGLLRSKINQAVEQERAIFVRLGELYVELQSRENWAWTGSHGTSFMGGSIPATPSVYSAMSPISCTMPTPTTPLNATSAEFIPQSYFGDDQQLSDPPWCQKEAAEAGRALDTVVEEGEEPLCNHDVSHEYIDGEEIQMAGDADYDAMPWIDAGFRARRLSLPSIQTAWPET
ncbi:hypothetical protein AK830_g465 [Neonectria ditissima]|uniref:Uncharacterized protein n=1 Tax=Neonectria ditissima TaxID=78410 RepID=A0A0P7BGX5_9HYPO|nr:hypothetical protein AK830_g465 [Neonectria ditissima]